MIGPDNYCDVCQEHEKFCTCPPDDDPMAGGDPGEYDDPGPEPPDDEGAPVFTSTPVTAVGPDGSEPWTELGCANRLAARFGAGLRYVGTWGRWLVWDGKRWAADTTGQAARWAKVVARDLTNTALAIPDAGERRSMLRIAARMESAAGIRGILTLAASDEKLAVTHEQLDADPFLLNCRNGTLDLGTIELRPHDPADLLTKMTAANYDPAAVSGEWDGFLERVQPDPAMRAYLARLTGHAIEGRVIVHILPIFAGSGANGKSTYVNAVAGALGDYAAPADPDLLTARTFDAHPTSVADLFGKRLAILHETDHGRRLAEGTVKRLTGGDEIKARRMREDFWSFRPAHTFLMLTNHRPVVSGTDEGLWRRIKLIPWDVVIPVEERDEDLGDRLALELGAVLTWVIRGYTSFRADGLADPEQVTMATAAYRAESDALSRFIEQCCLSGRHFHVRSAELFAAWCQWCATEGEQSGSQTAFSKALTDRGLDSRKVHGRMVWSGLGLASEEEGP